MVRRDELEPPERGEACDGGPHAESLGVGPPRPQPECAADGAPRVERTEDVTQQRADGTSPTQKTTYTKVGSAFAVATWLPAKPA